MMDKTEFGKVPTEAEARDVSDVFSFPIFMGFESLLLNLLSDDNRTIVQRKGSIFYIHSIFPKCFYDVYHCIFT